jgi:beta-lactam-binding protein with PASTA domain
VLAVSGSDDDGGRAAATTSARTATVVRVAVPDVVGLRLDVAREQLEGDGFEVEASGGGVLGIVVESNWEVQAQTPTAGTRRDPGAAVEVFVDRP